MTLKLIPGSNNTLMKDKSSFIRLWFLFSLALHLVIAWFSVGFYHFDEHFQILEFAGYKMGTIPASSLTWEFAAHLRSAFQPFIAFSVLKFLKTFAIAPPSMCPPMPSSA